MNVYLAKNETVELLENSYNKLDTFFYGEFKSVETDFCILIGYEDDETIDRKSLEAIYRRFTILEDFLKMRIDELYKVVDEIYAYSRENDCTDKILQMIECYKNL